MYSFKYKGPITLLGKKQKQKKQQKNQLLTEQPVCLRVTGFLLLLMIESWPDTILNRMDKNLLGQCELILHF